MATEVTTIMGLKACFAGAVGEDGAAGTTLTQITQPYQGGITITGTAPTINKGYREGQQFPAALAADVSSGGVEVTWEVMDWDAETLKFYFGDKAISGIPAESYMGEKTFRFDTGSGISYLIPRLQYVATPNGTIGSSEAMRFSVTGTVMQPKEGEMAIGIIKTPSAAPAMASMSASRSKPVESL